MTVSPSMDHALFPELTCPSCNARLSITDAGASVFQCSGCSLRISLNDTDEKRCNSRYYEATDTDISDENLERTDQIRLAYRFYSIFYDPLALLALYSVWRGRIRPQLRWYKDSYINAGEKTILDIAVGNGALTKLSCGAELKKHNVIFLDFSKDMLLKAIRKLKNTGNAMFLLANAERIPLPEDSIDMICCFGGIHTFSNRQACFNSMARVLKQNGALRGSILMQPKKEWARKLCHKVFIPAGLLSTTPTLDEIEKELETAQLKITNTAYNGDMLLFEALKL